MNDWFFTSVVLMHYYGVLLQHMGTFNFAQEIKVGNWTVLCSDDLKCIMGGQSLCCYGVPKQM
jgi:hypothetical protein